MKIRDLRKSNYFRIDNIYLNGYARIFGAIGTAIYINLCRHAHNETQQCFPSEKTIAEELDITDRTVRKYLQWFEKSKLIKITKERSKSGKWLNNVYYLIDKSEWAEPSEIISYGGHRKIKTDPAELKRNIHRKQFPTNKTHKNKTHKEEDSSFRKKINTGKRPFYNGFPMRQKPIGKWWVIPADGGDWLEYAGKESEIEWR